MQRDLVACYLFFFYFFSEEIEDGEHCILCPWLESRQSTSIKIKDGKQAFASARVPRVHHFLPTTLKIYSFTNFPTTLFSILTKYNPCGNNEISIVTCLPVTFSSFTFSPRRLKMESIVF